VADCDLRWELGQVSGRRFGACITPLIEGGSTKTKNWPFTARKFNFANWDLFCGNKLVDESWCDIQVNGRLIDSHLDLYALTAQFISYPGLISFSTLHVSNVV
jgi:hypothetical protein